MSELPHLLVVDSSKVVRASLTKKLKGSYVVREETNGESAWQTLILDPAIVAVIAGVSLPKLDGFGLLDKVRANKLSRLKAMSFFLIASDAMGEDIRAHALGCGVSGFIQKGASADQVLAVLKRPATTAVEAAVAMPPQTQGGDKAIDESEVADLGMSNIFSTLDEIAGIAHGKPLRVDAPRRLLAPLTPRHQVLGSLERLLGRAGPGERGVAVLVFSLDSYQDLAMRFGTKMADRIEAKFEQLLTGKLRAGDSLAKIAAHQIAIVAAETNLALCTAFAERICQRLSVAEVSVRGQPVKMTVSVGVASYPDDALVKDGNALFSLAESRLALAIAAGGNQVVNGVRRSLAVTAMKHCSALIESAQTETLGPQLGELGLLIMPLVKEIEGSFRLGLPLEKMESLLRAQVKGEHAAS